MLTSLAIIFLAGYLLSLFIQKIKLPGLIGLLLTGMIVGPYQLNLLDDSLLLVSADLRQIALIIILTRAGLSINVHQLKKVGRPAILLSFVPACFEIAAALLLAPGILGVSLFEAAIIGTVIAAVSPAVIIPKMILLSEKGYGKAKGIPDLIMAGASVDDIVVIMLFTALMALSAFETVNPVHFLRVLLALLNGLFIGFAAGFCILKLFKRFSVRDTIKVMILLSISFLFVAVEQTDIVPVAGLLAVMVLGAVIKDKNPVLAHRLSKKYAKCWVGAEIMLFVLLGAVVDISQAFLAGLPILVFVLCALAFRLIGVWVCLIKTKLTVKERLFCMIAYTPKATVQAAIGGVPLAMGLSCGQMVLTIAALCIIITAPLGSLGIDITYQKLLSKTPLLHIV